MKPGWMLKVIAGGHDKSLKVIEKKNIFVAFYEADWRLNIC